METALHPEVAQALMRFTEAAKYADEHIKEAHGEGASAQVVFQKDQLAAQHRTMLRAVGCDLDDDIQLKAIASVFADIVFGVHSCGEMILSQMPGRDLEQLPTAAIGVATSILIDIIVSACQLKGWLDEPTDQS